MYTVQKYRRVGFAIACGLLAVGTVYTLLPFWQAMAWGSALAILVYPIHSRLQTRFNRTVSAGITTVVTTVFIVGPLLLVGVLLYVEANQIVTELRSNSTSGNALDVTQLVDNANAYAKQAASDYFGIKDFDLRLTLQRAFQGMQFSPARFLSALLHGIMTFVFALLLLFFLLRDGYRLRQPALDLIPLPADETSQVLDSVYDMVHATFYGIVLVALAQGTVAGITYWLLGIPAAIMLGMATVILCTIPLLGAPVIWVPVAALLASKEQWWEAAIVVIIGIFVIGLIDNIFRPIIIGARVKVHPIAVFFSLIGGVFAFGPVGLLIGPVLLILTLAAIQVLRQIAMEEVKADAIH